MTTELLVLKRAPIGPNLEDYNVLENGVVVGRIFCLDAVGPQGRSWMWASGHSAATVKRAAHDTSRRARLRWPRSQRVGAGNRPALPLAPLGTNGSFFGFRLRSPSYVANFTFAVPAPSLGSRARSHRPGGGDHVDHRSVGCFYFCSIQCWRDRVGGSRGAPASVTLPRPVIYRTQSALPEPNARAADREQLRRYFLQGRPDGRGRVLP
jgi:hypothetical protein